MTTRAQAIIPIFIAAVIIGSIGLLTLPSEIKLEQVKFPIGMIKVDDIPLEVQIADTDSKSCSWFNVSRYFAFGPRHAFCIS